MKLLIVSLFIFQSLWAQTPPRKSYLKAEEIIYNPGAFRPGRFVIAYKDYEDIRLDVDLDGTIDFWYLKKGPTHVSLTYKDGQPQSWYVRSVGKTHTKEFLYELQTNGSLSLILAQERPNRVMNLPEGEDCGTSTPQEKVVENLNAISRGTYIEVVEEDLIDESCKELGTRNYQQLVSSLTRSLHPNSSSIAGCLKNPDFAKKFSADIKEQIDVRMIQEKYYLQAHQLLTQSKNHKPLISCKKDDKSAMHTDEAGKISISFGSGPDSKKLLSEPSLSHELLHRAGVISEESQSAIEKVCHDLRSNATSSGLVDKGVQGWAIVPAGDVANKISAQDQSADIEVAQRMEAPKNQAAAQTPPPKATGSQAAAAASTASIPKEMVVAQVGAPAAPTLSESISIPAPATEAGSQQALVRSASESRGVLSTANNLIGAMSTRAEASTSLADSERASSRQSSGTEVASNSKRAPASDKSGSKNTAADLLRSAARNEVRGNERIVEEITLEGVKAAPSDTSKGSGANTANNQNVPTGSRSDKGAPEMASATPSTSREISTGASSSTGGSSPSVSLTTPTTPGRSASGGPESSSSVGRSPASAATPSTAPAPAPSADNQGTATNSGRNEVVGLISSSNYSQTKAKLKEPGFAKKLEEQKITILDLYGNSYGATKGEVIFLDQGDRFVRQK